MFLLLLAVGLHGLLAMLLGVGRQAPRQLPTQSPSLLQVVGCLVKPPRVLKSNNHAAVIPAQWIA